MQLLRASWSLEGTLCSGLADIRKLEANRREKLQSRQKVSTNIVEEEDSWGQSHEQGFIDAAFADNSHEGEDVCEVAIAGLDIKGEDTSWYLDSGATRHVSRNREYLDSLESSSGNLKTGDGQNHAITGRGSVNFSLPSEKIKSVLGVLYVPSVRKNLLSIGSMTEQDCIECFDDKKCLLISNRHRKIIAEGIRNPRNGLYQLVAGNMEVQGNIATSTLELARLWHHRLGHLNYQRLHNLSANHMASRLPYIRVHQEVCKACQLGKSVRPGFPTASHSRATKPLQLLHIDLCGPLPTASLGGSRYFMVIVDDFRRYIWVRILQVKSQGRNVLSMLVITTLVVGIAESSVVREIGKLKQFTGNADTIPGLTHITIAGAVRDGHKEIEAWVETLAPGRGTPIHRHNCEEIFIILNGGGTVYIAPESDNNFPGEPEATPFSANSTFSIPTNSVRQVVNTNDEDMLFYAIISRPPIEAYIYKNWNTHHDDAVPMIPILWDSLEEATSTKDEL